MNVLLVGEDGERIGNVTLEEARRIAKKEGKSLKMVNATGGVYRIIDAGKEKYDQQQKRKQQSAQRRTHRVKEIQIRPTIDTHDLNVKINRARGFLQNGLKTKMVMKFKGRQMANTTAAEKKFREIIAGLVDEGLATIDRDLKFEGRNLVAFLVPPKELKE